MNTENQHGDIISWAKNFPGAIYRLDLRAGEDQYTFLNEGVETISGYPAEDFLSGKVKWLALVEEEDLPLARKAVQATSHSISYRMAYRIRHKSGSVCSVLNIGGISTFKNKPVWSDGVILDATE